MLFIMFIHANVADHHCLQNKDILMPGFSSCKVMHNIHWLGFKRSIKMAQNYWSQKIIHAYVADSR